MRYHILGRLSPIVSHPSPEILRFGHAMNITQFTKSHCIGWLALVLLTFIPQTIAHDTLQTITRLVVHQTPDTFELWNLNSDETLNFIADLTAYPKPEVALDVSPSPDGQRVGYTALLNGDTPLLILVSLNPLRVEQYKAPGNASLQWSPSSDALLLSRPSIFTDGDYDLANGDTYVFDLATENFTLVAETNTSQVIQKAKWLPDGAGIIYAADNRSSNLGDILIPDLFTVTRDGRRRQQLTNLRIQAPQSIDFNQPAPRNICSIDNFKWSTINERWYYVISCQAPDDDVIVSSLFSANLEGDNRLETDLYEQFPERFDPLTVVGYRVIDFFPSAKGIYLIVNSPDGSLLIVKVNGSRLAQIAAEFPQKTGRLAAFSGDDNYIAVSLIGGDVSILNLVGGQKQILSSQDSSFKFCRVQWLANTTLLIDEVSQCGTKNTSFIKAHQTTAWNILTGKKDDVTASLGGMNLIIPLPEASHGVRDIP